MDAPYRSESFCSGQAPSSVPTSSRRALYASSDADEPTVAVVARFRPLNEAEEQTNSSAPFLLTDSIEDRRKGVVYSRFNHVLDRTVPQADVYEATAKPLMQHVMAGYNAGMLAYGQSGGGKTYSMLGKEGDLASDLRGIVPRAMSDLFAACASVDAAEVAVSCSMCFFEVYKDELYDLLCYDVDGNSKKLAGREMRHMKNLTELTVENEQQANQIVQAGQEKRRYAWMPLNPVSSRSHGIIVFKVKRRFPDTSTSESALYFVDLMGSEALVSGGDGDETAAVNMDLLTLGKVIKALSDKKGKLVPPYRDSTLTWVLRDVLGGNCMATMLVTCSPHQMQYTATQNTLEFADQCMGIQRTLAVAEKKLNARELVSKVQRLQEQLAEAKLEQSKSEQIDELHDLLATSQQELTEERAKATKTASKLGRMEKAFEVQVTANKAIREQMATMSDTLTEQQSEQLLKQDLRPAVMAPVAVQNNVGILEAHKSRIEELEEELEESEDRESMLELQLSNAMKELRRGAGRRRTDELSSQVFELQQSLQQALTVITALLPLMSTKDNGSVTLAPGQDMSGLLAPLAAGLGADSTNAPSTEEVKGLGPENF